MRLFHRTKRLPGILLAGLFVCVVVMTGVLLVCNGPQADSAILFPRDVPLPQKTPEAKLNCDDKKISPFVYLVISAPSESLQRKALRETWLSTRNTSRHFCVGTAQLSESIKNMLLVEQREANDLILMEDFLDSYANLSEKILQCFAEVSNMCGFQYVLKCDTDTFVDVERLQTAVKEQSLTRLYWGFFAGGANVKRRGQWAEPSWILCDKYLPYARGGGYVLSRDLVMYITQNMEYFQRFNSEDVSVGAWLAPLQLHRVHDPRFDTEYRSRGCSNQYLVTHKQNVTMMYQLWRNLQQTGQLCQQEFRQFNSYVYDWNVLPSQCCVRNDSKIP